ETGVFVEGELTDGLRETSELATSKGAPFTYQFQQSITITPSKEVVSINAVASEVEFKSTDTDAQYKQAADLMDQDQYDKALYLFLKLIDQQGYNPNFKVQASFCYLMLQDIDHASIYAQQAINVNQTEFTAYLVKGLAEIAQNDLPAAEKSFKEAFYFDYSGAKNTYTNSLIAMAEVNLNKGGCELMLDFVEGNYHSRDQSYATVRQEMTKADQKVQSDPIGARAHYKTAIQKSASITSRPWLKAYNTYVAGGTFYYANLFNEAKPFIEEAYLEVMDHKNTINPYSRLFLNTVLAEYATNTGDISKIQGYLNNCVPLMAELGDYANDLKAKFYQSQCNVFDQTNQHELLISSANKLKGLEKTGYDDYYKAKALNYLGMGYSKSGTAAGRKTSFDYFEQALSLAQEKGYEPIVEDIEEIKEKLDGF
ncbi:MAG: tetratricopeptide repeat protein, partial [Flavobacteriales bacterium]